MNPSVSYFISASGTSGELYLALFKRSRVLQLRRCSFMYPRPARNFQGRTIKRAGFFARAADEFIPSGESSRVDGCNNKRQGREGRGGGTLPTRETADRQQMVDFLRDGTASPAHRGRAHREFAITPGLAECQSLVS